MRDTRPLSERFDLTYVNRAHYADRWTGPCSLALVLVVVVFLGAATILGDRAAYSSGELTIAHDMFADRCEKCHAPDPARPGFFLPASDDKCLYCHATYAQAHHPLQSLYIGGHVKLSNDLEIQVASECSLCHVEHRGRDIDLTSIPDQFCVQCHADLAARGINPELVRAGSGRVAPDLPPPNGAPADASEPAPDADSEGGAP